MIKNLTLFAGSVSMLVCGVLWKEMDIEGSCIFLIMCSLYMAMWLHAGILSDRINAKLDEIKDEIGKSGSVEKSAR